VIPKDRVLRRDTLFDEAKLSKLCRHKLRVAKHASAVRREAIHCHQSLEKLQGFREMMLDY
jgi:hypothetical protein